MYPPQKSILITGCSSGFGRATALRFCELGWRVFATVRKPADGESLLDEAAVMSAQGGVAQGMPLPEIILCDVTKEEDVRALGQAVAATTPHLHALVNNAGSGYPLPLELLPIADLRAQLELNVIGQIAVTQAVLPLIRAAKGTIINVSSQGGKVAFPITGAYHASKFALEGLSDSLRVELAHFGVKVVVIQPGSSPTPIWETSRQRAFDNLRQQGKDVGVYEPLINAVLRAFKSLAQNGFPPGEFAALVEHILTTRLPVRARYALPMRTAVTIFVRGLLPDEVWDWVVRRGLGW